MHILLTDILSCPRCGPEFGLILLADRIEDRRVHAGTLGCANCRERYEVRDGFGDLRPQGTSARPLAEGVTTVPDTDEEALRVAALMGVTEGPGFVLLAGPVAALATRVAGLIADIEVVAAGAGVERSAERPGTSRVAVAGRLPFYSGKLRAAWLAGGASDAMLEEGVRAVGPAGRLVLEPAPADAEARLEAAGMKVIARKDDTLVAARA